MLIELHILVVDIQGNIFNFNGLRILSQLTTLASFHTPVQMQTKLAH